MNDLLRRKGIFKITGTLINQSPENVLRALNDVLIVGVDTDFMTDTLTYRGYSPHFDIIAEGEAVPYYHIEIVTENNKITKVEWHREKENTERDVKAILDEINKSLIYKR